MQKLVFWMTASKDVMKNNVSQSLILFLKIPFDVKFSFSSGIRVNSIQSTRISYQVKSFRIKEPKPFWVFTEDGINQSIYTST